MAGTSRHTSSHPVPTNIRRTLSQLQSRHCLCDTLSDRNNNPPMRHDSLQYSWCWFFRSPTRRLKRKDPLHSHTHPTGNRGQSHHYKPHLNQSLLYTTRMVLLPDTAIRRHKLPWHRRCSPPKDRYPRFGRPSTKRRVSYPRWIR